MQGLGRPGVHQFTVVPPVFEPLGGMSEVVPTALQGCPLGKKKPTIMPISFFPKQIIPKTLIHKAIPGKQISFQGTGGIAAPVEDQFKKYSYPIPQSEGGTHVRMIWSDTPCRSTCWNCGSETIESLKSPQIETIIVQHPWLENDCVFADIILPIKTKFEEKEIGVDMGSLQYCLIFPEGKCIEPLGESKSDYEAVCQVADKLGLYKEYTSGKSVDEWIQAGFEGSGVQDMITWKELNEKGYYVVPTRDNWDKDPAGIINFYNDPEGNPLTTPSGKIEFYSERLAANFPDDKERPPVPHWIEKGETHDENLSSGRAKKYPLLMMSNHPRWRVHAQCDDISWTHEFPTCKVKGADGYLYEPCWLNPVTAAQRGIENGDIVQVFNERGTVLAGAYVTERLMRGVAYVDHGSRCDWIIPGKLDRGGAINLISPDKTISKNCAGQATSGYLVQVEKVTAARMEEWMKQYPEAFARKYDRGSGLRFDAWVERGVD